MNDDTRRALKSSLFASTSPFESPLRPAPTPSETVGPNPLPVGKTTVSHSEQLAEICELIELALAFAEGDEPQIISYLQEALEVARRHA